MVIQTIVAGAIAYSAVVGIMWALQRRLMYNPDTTASSRRQGGVPEMDEVTITGDDGLVLVSWYRPAPRAVAPTVVYFQGNAGNLTERGDKVRPYLDRAMGVLLVGYRGYGANPGRPSEKGLYVDARAALNFLSREGIPPARWVIYGESLGTGIAVQMAWEYAAKGAPVGCVVLEAPFTSMGDAGRHRYPFLPVKTLARDRYDSLSKIARIDTPLCVVHGTADPTVPVGQGRAVFAAALPPKEALWVEGGKHSDLYDFNVQIGIVDFIKKYLNSKS
ncbi:alpha/beta hydrolase [Varunaivibrio sulfuroxidans]|uniref:AB hydrolase-1 domain-containing protein n=1 Tax=Varunaivibrio sulfuroxidans TaxID=1773489 RepID=A0A4R3JE58_9PROT|nr:alpha/beta hydrolase [Varunaivibrio sulfuroxidans]TCS64057.1 hypothetical protein EDD55_10294 [Varunaivibrio sulfuroxidans]WES31492.1 alpha/beta hydrolase [Varunaivibrio sulfuroxidans]